MSGKEKNLLPAGDGSCYLWYLGERSSFCPSNFLKQGFPLFSHFIFLYFHTFISLLSYQCTVRFCQFVYHPTTIFTLIGQSLFANTCLRVWTTCLCYDVSIPVAFRKVMNFFYSPFWGWEQYFFQLSNVSLALFWITTIQQQQLKGIISICIPIYVSTWF